MITKQQVRQMVSDNAARYDFSCYPMSCEEFIDLMTDTLSSVAKVYSLEFEDITQEMFDEADDIVCSTYVNAKILSK